MLIVPTTQPEPIEAYSIRVAEKWQIGRKGKDNGVLFLVAKNDKKMRIEVGYGLEGMLTDATSRRIIAENVAPLFREGKFAAGIDAGVDRIISVVAEGKPLPPREAPRASTRAFGGHFDFGTMLLILFIVVPLVGSVLRSIFGRLAGIDGRRGHRRRGGVVRRRIAHHRGDRCGRRLHRDDLRRRGLDDGRAPRRGISAGRFRRWRRRSAAAVAADGRAAGAASAAAAPPAAGTDGDA